MLKSPTMSARSDAGKPDGLPTAKDNAGIAAPAHKITYITNKGGVSLPPITSPTSTSGKMAMPNV